MAPYRWMTGFGHPQTVWIGTIETSASVEVEAEVQGAQVIKKRI